MSSTGVAAPMNHTAILATVQLTAKIGMGSQNSIVPLAPFPAPAAATNVLISKPPWPPSR